jgi:hypothetical protein
MQHDFILVGGDTDGLAFKRSDEKPFTLEEQTALLAELNSLTDGLIHWENDGMVRRQIVVKAKNYLIQDMDGKVKTKGSALKATTKEKALQLFIAEVLELLLKDRKDHIFSLYFKYANAVLDLKDITEWSMKKTVTKAVLTSDRTNETRVLDALEGSDFTEGDKCYMFYKTPTELCLRENFDGTYCVDTLLGKLYDTMSVFDTIIDMDLFPNFTLVRNRSLLGLEVKSRHVTQLAKKVAQIHSGVLTKLAVSEAADKVDAFPPEFWQVRES